MIENKLYFRNMSDFELILECNYGSKSRNFSKLKVVSAFLYSTDRDVHLNGISLPDKRNVEVDVLMQNKLFLVRIGYPRTFFLSSSTAVAELYSACKREKGMMAYWDRDCVCFVVNSVDKMLDFKNFLENFADVYVTTDGIWLR